MEGIPYIPLPIQSMQPLLSLYANLSHDHHPPSVPRLFLVSLQEGSADLFSVVNSSLVLISVTSLGLFCTLTCSVSELSFDSETFSCSHLRSLPGDSADAVALVEQRLVGRREQRVFKQMSILLTLSPQSRERLTLVRNRHHPAHTNTDRCGYGGKSLNYPQCGFCICKNIKRLLL